MPSGTQPWGGRTETDYLVWLIKVPLPPTLCLQTLQNAPHPHYEVLFPVPLPIPGIPSATVWQCTSPSLNGSSYSLALTLPLCLSFLLMFNPTVY